MHVHMVFIIQDSIYKHEYIDLIQLQMHVCI